MKTEPQIRHLVLTCNSAGSLATAFLDDPRVTVITLNEATNDQSLVMTSSFTNLVLGARFLGLLEEPARYRAICEKSGVIACQILEEYFRHFGAGGESIISASSFSR